MVAVPLGLQSYLRKRGSQPETRLVNMYLEEDDSGASPDDHYRLQRPGLQRLLTFPDPIRGIYQQDGVLDSQTFVVAGDKLYASDLGSFTVIGTITNDGDTVSMAANFDRIAVVTAGEFWTYDGTTLIQIDLPDNQSIVDMDVINSYFIVGLSSGTFFWLEPGTIVFNALDFATAESLPDSIVGIRRLKDDLYFFGSRSIEIWQATGLADATFQRAPGRLIDRGLHSRDTVAQFDNTLIFCGEDGIVYRLSDVPTRVSTFGIEEHIRLRTDLCSGFVFTTEGHKFYVLKIPGQGSFAYDASTKCWSEFSTFNATTWSPSCGQDTNGGPLCADASGKLYRLNPDQVTDDGLPINRLVTGTIPLPPKPVRQNSFSVGLGSDVDTVVAIRYRDARDTDWSTPAFLTVRAGSDVVDMWRLGATRGAWRTFEISTNEAVKIRISGAFANESWAV